VIWQVSSLVKMMMMSYSPWLSHHRHRRRHRHHSLPRRREGYVYRRVTMWHANDFKGNGFTTGRHGTSKMAGFGASRQPRKSSVNLYIRIFCTTAATAGKNVNQTVSLKCLIATTTPTASTPATPYGKTESLHHNEQNTETEIG
jgi:hypothetical protein